jgi:hypothetical protein
LLTEQEVSKSWRRLFQNQPFTADVFEKAEILIDELRPESPLRHRLSGELAELRTLHKKSAKVRA